MAVFSRPCPALRIVSVNVNGLSSAVKRRALFAGLGRQQHDIAVLQETHLASDEDAEALLAQGSGTGRPWAGRAFWSHGRRAARGVAVLFAPGFAGIDIQTDYSDGAATDGGRVLRVGWTDSATGQRWAVVAIYAPNLNAAQRAFFAPTGPVWAALEAGYREATVLVAGDFNCILEADDGSTAAAAAQAASEAAAALRGLVVHFNLTDAWRQCRSRAAPSTVDCPFTHIATHGGSARRLDRVYVTADAVTADRLVACRHLPLGVLPGDHCPVELSLAGEGRMPRHGPPRWRLPVDLLYDQHFVDDIRTALAALRAGSGGGWDELATASAMERWLHFKQLVRDVARRHMFRRRRQQGRQRRELEGAVRAAMAAYTCAVAAGEPGRRRRPGEDPKAAAERVRLAADKLRQFETQQAARDAAKADAVWHRYGEKPTFWFHRLGEAQSVTAPMTAVLNPTSPGTRVEALTRHHAMKGAEIIADFFDGERPQGLFAPRSTDSAAQTAMLAHIDSRLEPDVAASADGPRADGALTEEELKAAMASMQRGKSPGMDGIPYEFYRQFWDDLVEPLLAAANEPFLAADQQGTPPTYDWRFTVGAISLLFKGTPSKPLPDDQVASYRPITLLNADYKVVAKAIANRLGPALESVVDDTQTAFLPGRWIGDNVLCHLGIIDTLNPEGVVAAAAERPPRMAAAQGQAEQPQAQPPSGRQQAGVAAGTQAAWPPATAAAGAASVTPQPPQAPQGQPHTDASSGCMLFLDFEKAYDRLAREWILACLEAMGFRTAMLRWIALLLEGTRAIVSFGGVASRVFAVRSGAAQGSPLSPLLYVAAAQPLSAALRRLQAAGHIDAIRLPGGVTTPASHMHADDTCIHTATVEGAKRALDLAITPFCAASGSQLNVSKSEGLTLGGHPPLEGRHGPTGITFVGPSGTVKHLGILLTKGSRTRAAEQMWQRRVGSVAARVQHWRTVDLTLLGRIYVAKQVMAATVTYHASFVQPPPRQLRSMQRLIDGFVLGQPVNPSTDDRPLRGRPPAEVRALPYAEGGLAAADVELQAAAMRAKVVAQLLHPRRRPWKCIATAAFEAALPGLGVTAVLTTLEPRRAAARGLPPWLASCWAAMRATKLHRLVQPGDMMAQQVEIEPLAGNRRVARADNGTLRAVPWAAAIAAWGAARRLRDIVPSAGGHLPAIIPAEWETALRCRPMPPSPWAVSGDGKWVRVISGQAAPRYFAVSREGRLLDPSPSALAAATAAAVAAGGWRGCCIIQSPLVKGRPAGAQQPIPKLRPYDPPPPEPSSQEDLPGVDLYLVGPWDETPQDPSLWGHAGVAVTHFTVKDATLRLKQFDAAAKQQSQYSPTVAVAPALWGTGAVDHPDPTAVDRLAARQQEVFRRKLAGVGAAPATGRADDRDLAAIYRQPWMDPSPTRQLPQQRAAQRVAASAAAAAGATAADDCTDPLQPWDDPPLAWRAAWTQAHVRPRPRPHRVFTWQLLHAALPCGAACAQFYPPNREGLAEVACCANPACRPGPAPNALARGAWRLETLAHALLHCPAVRPAILWLTKLWTRVEGGPGPPTTPAVWLQADTSQWRPQARHAALWSTLRTSLLATAWSMRQRRLWSGEPFTPREVVEDCVGDVRRLVMADWARVVSAITEMEGTHRSWFPGRDPRLTVIEFETFWCPSSVVAHVTHSQGSGDPSLDFRMTPD